MKKQIPAWLRTLAVSVATGYFFSNVGFAYTPEKNLWAERRRHLEKSSANHTGQQDNLLLASLPVASSPAALFQSLPSSARVTSALSEEMAKTLPLSLTAGHAKLFHSLQTTHGTIRKVWLPAKNAGDRVVVHIQDVHQNQDAQRHIGGAIESLLQSGQAGVVGLEGGFTPIDVKAYHDYQNREVIRLTADYLLKKNLITGPVHMAMTTPAPLAPMIGVDDPVHYNANVEAYRQSAPKMDAYKKAWEAQKYKMSEEKKNVFSPALLAFDEKVETYHARGEGLAEYVNALAPQRGVGPAGLLAQAFEMEKSLDFTKVESDRKSLIDALVKTLTQDQINQLVQESASYRVGQVRYAEFYTYLKNLCRSAKVDLAKYPHMDAYIRYVLLSDRIDGEKLLTELANLEKARYAELVKTEEEKFLVTRSRAITLAGRLLTFELTPEDWADYEKINAGQSLGLDMTSFESFYKEAHARDESLTANLLKAMDEGDHKTAVLVTGGYHTEGVSERLTKAGVAVVTFTPRIETLDTESGSTYLSIFTQEKTPLEKLFAGEKLFMSQSPYAPATEQATAPAVAAGASAIIESPAKAMSLFATLGDQKKRIDVEVKGMVATVILWGSNAASAVNVIVSRTVEGDLTVQESVAFAFSIATVMAFAMPFAMEGIQLMVSTLGGMAALIPGASLFTDTVMSIVTTPFRETENAIGNFSYFSGTSFRFDLSQIVPFAAGVLILVEIVSRISFQPSLQGTKNSPHLMKTGNKNKIAPLAVSFWLAAFLGISSDAPAAPVASVSETSYVTHQVNSYSSGPGIRSYPRDGKKYAPALTLAPRKEGISTAAKANDTTGQAKTNGNPVVVVKKNIQNDPVTGKYLGMATPNNSHTIVVRTYPEYRTNVSPVFVGDADKVRVNFAIYVGELQWFERSKKPYSYTVSAHVVFKSKDGKNIKVDSNGSVLNLRDDFSTQSGVINVPIPSGAYYVDTIVLGAKGYYSDNVGFKNVRVDLTRTVQPPVEFPQEIKETDPAISAPKSPNDEESGAEDHGGGAPERQFQDFPESTAGRALHGLSPVLLLLALMVVSPDALAEIMNRELFFEAYESIIWGTSLAGIAVMIFGYRYNRKLDLTAPVILFLGILAVLGLNFIFQGKNLYDASKNTPVSANTADHPKKIEKDLNKPPIQDKDLKERGRPIDRPNRPERGNLGASEQINPWKKLSAFVALTAGFSIPSWAGEVAVASSSAAGIVPVVLFLLAVVGFFVIRYGIIFTVDAFNRGRADAEATGKLFSMDPANRLNALMSVEKTTDAFAPSKQTMVRMASAQRNPVAGFIYRMAYLFFASAEAKAEIKRGLKNNGTLYNAMVQSWTIAPEGGALPKSTLTGMTISREGMADLPTLLKTVSGQNSRDGVKHYLTITPGEGVDAQELSRVVGANNSNARVVEGKSPEEFVDGVGGAMKEMGLNPETTAIVMLSTPEFDDAGIKFEGLLATYETATDADSKSRRLIIKAILNAILRHIRVSTQDVLKMFKASQLAQESA